MDGRHVGLDFYDLLIEGLRARRSCGVRFCSSPFTPEGEFDNEAVRIIRGSTLETVARIMKNEEKARPLVRLAVVDYEHTREIPAAYFDKMPEHGRGELLLGLADGYSRLGDINHAQALFEQVRATLSGTVYAQSASLWLATKTPLPPAKAGCLGCYAGN